MRKDIKVLGIDLAKNIFQIHGTNAHGKKVLSKRLTRKDLPEFIGNLTLCLIGIEACTGAHYWARTFENYGHEVKMMAPQFVKPYVMSNKNDKNDARGIAEAVTRPTMKFVSHKTLAQQDLLLIHRARSLSMTNRTAQANQIRGLLADYGVVIAQGVSHIRKLPVILDDNKALLSEESLAIFTNLYEQFKHHDEQINYYDKRIEAHVVEDAKCQALLEIEGVGPLSASGIVATIGDPSVFKNGRELAAWLGLVPKQCSSGDRIRLGSITKRGDCYIRSLLIHGARCALKYVENKNDRKSQWACSLLTRMAYNKAAVALANKHARIIWAILTTGESYRKDEVALCAAA